MKAEINTSGYSWRICVTHKSKFEAEKVGGSSIVEERKSVFERLLSNADSTIRSVAQSYQRTV